MPLSGVRLLSIERQKPHGGGTGLIIEYDEYLESGVHDRIVCGMALDYAGAGGVKWDRPYERQMV